MLLAHKDKERVSPGLTSWCHLPIERSSQNCSIKTGAGFGSTNKNTVWTAVRLSTDTQIIIIYKTADYPKRYVPQDLIRLIPEHDAALNEVLSNRNHYHNNM